MKKSVFVYTYFSFKDKLRVPKRLMRRDVSTDFVLLLLTLMFLYKLKRKRPVAFQKLQLMSTFFFGSMPFKEIISRFVLPHLKPNY